jgi:amidase
MSFLLLSHAISKSTESRFAGIATLPSLPATVAPIERSASGLLIGVQIIGPYLEDRTTIAFAALIEREFGGFVPPPGYTG